MVAIRRTHVNLFMRFPATIGPCPCGPNARTTRAARIRAAKPSASATSTSPLKRRGAARPTAPPSKPRLADVNWTHGELLAPPTPPEPPGLDENAVRLLDEAEDIVNAAGPSIMRELRAKGSHDERMPWWKRFGRQR